LNKFGHFYHAEIGQPPSEWGLVAMDSELVHWYLMKQGYSQMKYNFITHSLCRNPTLAKCGGEAQHFQSWGLGVLQDS